MEQLLSPLTVNEFLVRGSFSFSDKVSSFCRGNLMASLNVQGLFTNIPLNDVIDICIDNLLFDVNTIHVDSLDRNDITEL